jgi:hypothetical protein
LVIWWVTLSVTWIHLWLKSSKKLTCLQKKEKAIYKHWNTH